jgi:acyl-CoA thioester hydrolase
MGWSGRAGRPTGGLPAIVLQIVILALVAAVVAIIIRSCSMSSEPAEIQLPSGTFESRLELRWGDMDALHHVNNTVYFRYFEEARVRLFARVHPDVFARRALVLARTSCDFLKPLLYPASIVVGLKLMHVGRSSLEFECWIADAENRQSVHATGRSVIVCVDMQTQRPVPWTDEELQALQRCFSE